jgi:hypothetical protein
MPLPVFKDFDKDASDIFGEDFDTKHVLKIKTNAPNGITFTTNTTICPTNGLKSKVSGKFSHSCGFTLDKFEIENDGKVSAETSLTGVQPNLKIGFKGDSKEKSDLSATYNLPAATAFAEVDVLHLKSANASVVTANGPFTVGASANFNLADKFGVSSNTIGLGYALNSIFVGLRVNDFKSLSGVLSYSASNILTFAGKTWNCAKDNKQCFGLAAVYKCNDNTAIKVKGASCGTVSASVKQFIDKKFTVTGAVEGKPTDSSSWKWGVNATLG